MNEESKFLVGLHLSQLFGLLIPMGGIICAGMTWYALRDEGTITRSSKDIINFQAFFGLTALLVAAFGAVQWYLPISSYLGNGTYASMQAGLWGLICYSLWCFGIAVPVIAALRVSRGKNYYYPTPVKLIP